MENRFRRILVSRDLLASWLGEGTPASEAEEPHPDLKVMGVRADWDALGGNIELLVWSEDFDIVHPGGMPPLWNPAYRSKVAPAFLDSAIP